MTRKETRILKHRERDVYGVTLTIRERDTGVERVLVVDGLNTGLALREAVRQLDALEGDWYVQAFSTPETIYRDLQGSRNPSGSDKGLTTPEAAMLTRIGRLDLLKTRPPFAKSDGRRQSAY